MRQAGADAAAAGRHAVRSPWRCTWARWDAEPPHHILTRHDYRVRDVGIAPLATGQILVFSLDIFWHVRIVDAMTNENVELAWSLPDRINALTCTPLPGGGYALIAGTDTGSVRAWDIDSGKPLPWDLPLSPLDWWAGFDSSDGTAPADPAPTDHAVPLPRNRKNPRTRNWGARTIPSGCCHSMSPTQTRTGTSMYMTIAGMSCPVFAGSCGHLRPPDQSLSSCAPISRCGWWTLRPAARSGNMPGPAILSD